MTRIFENGYRVVVKSFEFIRSYGFFFLFLIGILACSIKENPQPSKKSLKRKTPHLIVDHPIVDIIEKYVILDEQRRKLSLDYIRTHYGIEQDEPIISPRIIVIHWTAINTLRDSYKALQPVWLPSHRQEIKRGGALNVGAHYLVDQDGTIYQLMPDSVFARHTIGLNLDAIGIENVGGTSDSPLTEKQLLANAKLVQVLTMRHNIKWLIGHFEYGQFRNTPLWREKDPSYFTEKVDPGPDFMIRLRELTKNLGLKSTP